MVNLLLLIFFAFGLIIGSFLNVVICRFNTGKSFGGRSACMSCQSTLCWYELIPLFSFITLQGRCKTCKTKISLQYPIVELVTGIIFASLFWKFQYLFFNTVLVFTIVYAFYALMFSLLIVIASYDIKHKIIPDIFAFTFGLFALLGVFLFSSDSSYIFSPHIPSVLDLLSGIIIATPFVMLWLFSGGAWMGLGDGKLALGLGWFLGLSSAFSAVVLAFWSGAIVGIVLMLISAKYKLRSEIPFAPYLVLGTILVFLYGFSIFSLV